MFWEFLKMQVAQAILHAAGHCAWQELEPKRWAAGTEETAAGSMSGQEQEQLLLYGCIPVKETRASLCFPCFSFSSSVYGSNGLET